MDGPSAERLRQEEIASAFLTAPPTIAQRIVRGKAKIRDAQIPYQVPSGTELLERLDSVLAVIYLVFGELANYHLAHAARADLCRRPGRTPDARLAYERALALAQQGPERRFLEKRLRELG